MKYVLRQVSASTWSQPSHFGQAVGKADTITMIQSSYGNPGNLELVYPDPHTGLRFMWRNNG